MLIDETIKIKVTNDGVNNNEAKVFANTDSKLIDVLVSIEMAREMLDESFKKYLENFEIGAKDAQNIMKTIKIKDVIKLM